MKNLSEEIEKIILSFRETDRDFTPTDLHVVFDGNLEVTKEQLLKLFRSWALEMTNALGQSTKGRENKSTKWNDGYVEALFDIEKKIEEASK